MLKWQLIFDLFPFSTTGLFRYVQFRFICLVLIVPFSAVAFVRYGAIAEALSEKSLITTLFFAINLGEFGHAAPEKSEAK